MWLFILLPMGAQPEEIYPIRRLSERELTRTYESLIPGVPVSIENDEVTGGKRVVYYQGGKTTFDWRKPQKPVPPSGQWANVDSQLGLVMVTDSAAIQAMSLSADASQTAVSPAVMLQIIPVYPLQIAVEGRGSISTYPSSGPYASNSVVVLYPHALNYWAFDHWTGDLTGSQNPASLTMNGPRSVQAVFVQTDYPLTLSTPGGGSVRANGQVLFQPTYFSTSGEVTLTAVASNAWSFMGWAGDASGTNTPLGLTMNQTNQVQGIFGTGVETNVLGPGRIVLSQTNPVPYGTSLTATAVPAPGNYFVVWSGAASGTNNPTAFSVTSPTQTVWALFSCVPADKYPLSVVMIGAYAGLTVTGAVGNSYPIQYSPDPAATNVWTTLTNLTLQQPIQIWVDTNVNALRQSRRYYRVLPQP